MMKRSLTNLAAATVLTVCGCTALCHKENVTAAGMLSDVPPGGSTQQGWQERSFFVANSRLYPTETVPESVLVGFVGRTVVVMGRARGNGMSVGSISKQKEQ
jgi:hypothetical protein